jgi:hypothetical protein
MQKLKCINSKNNQVTYYMPRAKKVVYNTQIKSIFIPVNIDLINALPEEEHKHVDKYYYLLHQLYLRRVTDVRITKNTLISVNYDLLREFLTHRHIDKVLDYWRTAGVVERSGNFIPGTRSYGYRFTEAYRDVRNQKVTITDQKFADKLERKRRERNLKIDLKVPQHSFIYFNLQEIEIDAKAAYNIAFAANSTKKGTRAKREKYFNKWNTAIHALEHKEWFITRDKTGKRVHNNFVNAPSKIRETMTIPTGEQLVNVDIRCSQPLMLAIILKNEFAGASMPPKMLDYIQECEQGTLYETLASKAGIAAISDRKKFKRNFFKKVLYGRNENATRSPEWAAFASLYPDVAAYIVTAKAANYKALSHALQRQESEIIIDGVFGGLAADYYPADYFALPIHDSIVVCKSNEADIKHRIISAFQRHYITPTLHREDFN